MKCWFLYGVVMLGGSVMGCVYVYIYVCFVEVLSFWCLELVWSRGKGGVVGVGVGGGE